MAAHEMPLKTRQEEIADIWKENTWLYAVGGFLAGVLFFPFLQLAITNITDLLGSLVPEGIGLGFTVLFIDVLYRRREDQRRIKDLQEQLVRDAGSLVKDVAVNAVHQMRKQRWLRGDDGLLRDANLYRANLEGADLMLVHLERAELWGANLKGADLNAAHLEGAVLALTYLEGANLYRANLEGADLMLANLEGAELGQANLKGTRLYCAHLEKVQLVRANLEGADLEEGHLEGANLEEANLEGADLGADVWKTAFNENTILPDGSKWAPDTDMRRFIDPEHPDFWRSDEPLSPAYRGKDSSE